MKTIFHAATSRGYADHGWLKSHHTFSFANYYDPSRMHFGMLRVLNDDFVAAGMGFGTHPHSNMEIISIPLSGDLEHMDSMGHKMTIRQNDVQVMSAGTGVTHSEYNKNADKEVRFLQIWIIPDTKNVAPRYMQKTFSDAEKENTFLTLVGPDNSDLDLRIHQNAWISSGIFDAGTTTEYAIKDAKNGVYLFLLNGKISLGDQVLSSRDGMGIWECDKLEMKVLEKAEILLLEIPMN